VPDLNLTSCEELITPNDLKKKLPIHAAESDFISRSRQTIREILSGKDPRLLCIVGPCSIHDITSAKEVALKLKNLADRYSGRFYFAMRVYLEKPRTGLGWKGLLYDPFLNHTQDMAAGLEASRELLLFLAKLQLPAATEFLDLATIYYLSDLISWGCIGARTSSSQFHRQIASGLSMPIGFKNNTDGNVVIAVEGVQAAKEPHSYLGLNPDGKVSLLHTKGNPDCHIVLRGGLSGPNYDPYSIDAACNCLKKANLPLNLLVDCSHDNSFREHEKQVGVFQTVVEQYLKSDTPIRGLLLESHLFEGRQPMCGKKPLRYGVSITDSCLDWATTENLMQWAYERCKSEKDQELILR
jgi:3-deoxy-7-phosphoheptulonate synthase